VRRLIFCGGPQTFGLAVITIGVWLILAAPLSIGSDAIIRFEMLSQLLRDGTIPSEKYSLYGPLAATPFWYLGEALDRNPDTVFVFNRVIFLAGLAGLWVTLRPLLSDDERQRFIVLLLLGSMFPYHVMSFFAEVFHAVCVGLGLALIVVRPGWLSRLGCVLVVWGTANVPAASVGLAFAALVLTWQRRKLRYLLLPAATAAFILLENWVRRGDAFQGGYEGEAGNRTALPYSGQPGFSYPLFFGLLAVLFSFGKGLVFFTPGLFARLPEADPKLPHDREADLRLVYRVWLAVVVGLVLVYARWWAWYGGAVWGPRFFLFACLPASLVLARWSARPERHSLGANLLVLVAVASSCWVGANGIVYLDYDHALFRDNDFALEFMTWFVPECSVLWRPFVVHKPLDKDDFVRLIAFGVGFVYLAWPVGIALGQQLRTSAVGLWRVARTGSRWKF